MDKITYLAELAEGLARWVPERERQDILRYYAEYFEEAGPEREAEVVAELGDPWALSSRLAVEGGYVSWEKAASWRPKKKWPKVLLGTAVGLTVFTLVFGIGLLAINVMRTAADRAWRTSVAVQSEPEFIVDWGLSPVWGEFNVGYGYSVDSAGAMGPYLIDSESVASFHSIDIDISLGNIEVLAGDDYTLSVRRSEPLGGYEPALEIRDGVLRIRDGDLSQPTQVHGWDDLKKLFGANQLAVDVTITVPDTAALDRISVKTGLGSVLLYGLSAETVTAETGLGDVECHNVWGIGRLELSTGLGDINLGMVEARDGLYISLKSGKGNVDASLCGFETDYSYSLESGMGCVTVNGGYQNTRVVRRGNQPYELDAGSGMGDVNVWFTFD